MCAALLNMFSGLFMFAAEYFEYPCSFWPTSPQMTGHRTLILCPKRIKTVKACETVGTKES